MVRGRGITGIASTCLLCAGLLLCAGCGSLGSDDGRAHVASATITGTLVSVGGPGPGAPRPVAGDVSVTRGGKVIATVHTTDGSFSMAVPPGRYVVSGRLGTVPCTAPRPVDAAARGTAVVEVACSVK